MVLQDLGRRINTAVSDLTRAPNLDEKAKLPDLHDPFMRVPVASSELISDVSCCRHSTP